MKPNSNRALEAYGRLKQAHQETDQRRAAPYPDWLSRVRNGQGAAEQAVHSLEAALYMLLTQGPISTTAGGQLLATTPTTKRELVDACNRIAATLRTKQPHGGLTPAADALDVIASELRFSTYEPEPHHLPAAQLWQHLHQLATQAADRDAASITPFDVTRFTLHVGGTAEAVDIYALDGIGLLHASRALLPPEAVRLVGDDAGQHTKPAWPAFLADLTPRDLADFNPGRFCSRAFTEVEWELCPTHDVTETPASKRLLLINAAKLKVPFSSRSTKQPQTTMSLDGLIRSPHGRVVILVPNQALTAGRGMAQERWHLLKAAGLRRVIQLPVGTVGPRHHEYSIMLLERDWTADEVDFVELRESEHTRPALRGFGHPRRGRELALPATQAGSDGLPNDALRAVASAKDLAEARRAKGKRSSSASSRLVSFEVSRALRTDPFESLKDGLELRPLSSFMEVFRSHHIRRADHEDADIYWEVGTPEIDTMGMITPGPEVKCSKAALANRRRQILQADDLIMCFRGARDSIGRVGRYRMTATAPVVPNQSFVILRMLPHGAGFTPPPVGLVFRWLRTQRVKEYLRLKTVTPDVPRLAPKDIMSILVPVGPEALIERQSRLQEEFEAIVTEAESLRQRLAQIESLDWV